MMYRNSVQLMQQHLIFYFRYCNGKNLNCLFNQFDSELVLCVIKFVKFDIELMQIIAR